MFSPKRAGRIRRAMRHVRMFRYFNLSALRLVGVEPGRTLFRA